MPFKKTYLYLGIYHNLEHQKFGASLFHCLVLVQSQPITTPFLFHPLMISFLDSIFILSLYPLSLSTSRNGWVRPWKLTWKWRASLRLKGARNILVTLTPVKTMVSAQGRVPNTPVSANRGGLVTTVIRILMNALEVLIFFTYFNNPVFDTKCVITGINWTSLWLRMLIFA